MKKVALCTILSVVVALGGVVGFASQTSGEQVTPVPTFIGPDIPMPPNPPPRNS